MSKDNRQTIRRSQHNREHPFFLVSRDTAQEKSLSYEALGMLTYLLSKPQDWRAQIDDLQRHGAGRDKVRRILKELVEAGYATPPQRFKGEGGKWCWTPYEFHERPTSDGFPVNGEPSTAAPSTAAPETANPSSLQNRESQNTEGQSTEKQKTETKERDSAANAAPPNPQPDAFMQSFGEAPLLAAYLEAHKAAGRRAPAVRRGSMTHLELEGDLAAAGYTPEQVKALTLAKLKTRAGYPIHFLREDLPEWVNRQTATDDHAQPHSHAADDGSVVVIRTIPDMADLDEMLGIGGPYAKPTGSPRSG